MLIPDSVNLDEGFIHLILNKIQDLLIPEEELLGLYLRIAQAFSDQLPKVLAVNTDLSGSEDIFFISPWEAEFLSQLELLSEEQSQYSMFSSVFWRDLNLVGLYNYLIDVADRELPAPID